MHSKLLKKIELELKLRGYSMKTVKAYQSCINRYLTWIKDDYEKLNIDKIKQFILWLIEKEFASSTVNLYINSIRFFYREVLDIEADFRIPNPKRRKRLPIVLSKNEIQSILDSITNKKHRTMIALAYSAGLRVSEVVKLRVKDLDIDDLTINIRQSKWKKDRMTIISEKLVPDLRIFCKGKEWGSYLFSSGRGWCLHTRSIQNVFHRALKKAWIKKKASFHSLRHSFATHLIENGVDVTYIQNLLGHSNVRTTMIYTQVSNSMLQKIISPF